MTQCYNVATPNTFDVIGLILIVFDFFVTSHYRNNPLSMSRAKGLHDDTVTKSEWKSKTRKGGRDTARPVESTSGKEDKTQPKRQRKDDGPSNANLAVDDGVHLHDDESEPREEEPTQRKTTVGIQ